MIDQIKQSDRELNRRGEIKISEILKKFTILAQSDTTAGFFSNNEAGLNLIKARPADQKILKEIGSFKELPRVPKFAKNLVKRAKKTTFIFPNSSSYRVNSTNALLEFGPLYSTSANRAGEGFETSFALQKCDILAIDARGIYQSTSSKMIKLSRTRALRIR